MDKQKISIIVPVYNIAAYLDECVASLTAQTHGDLEILLIDDGSTDGSGDLCEAWARRDHRIRVIRKPNGGAASARNAGLDAAAGDYICFVDSDDVVEPDYGAHLLRMLEKSGADAAVCSFSFWRREGQEPQPAQTAPGLYTGEAYMLQFLRDWSCSLLWNKIFRREVIGGLRMAEGHRIDDEYFTYQVCMNCRTVAVTDRCLYHYRMRASSAVQDAAARQEQLMGDRIGYVTQRYEHIAQRMPALEDAYFADALNTMTRYWRHSRGLPDAQRQIRRWINGHLGRILAMNYPLRRRLAYLKALYCTRPAVMGEPNPISLDRGAYFD